MRKQLWKLPFFAGNIVALVAAMSPTVRLYAWIVIALFGTAYALMRPDQRDAEAEQKKSKSKLVNAAFFIAICVVPGFVIGSLLSLGGASSGVDKCYGGGRYC